MTAVPLRALPPLPAEPTVRAKGIRYSFGDGPRVVQVRRFAVDRGETVAIVGPSGCGKTTFLRLLNGALTPDEGALELFGRPVGPDDWKRREFRRRIGFVYQDFHLVDRASVLDNVLSGRLGHVSVLRSLASRFSSEDLDRAHDAIDAVGLARFTERRVDRLSGGQRQRVGIARVLAQAPDLILADEPVSNLDPPLAHDMLELLTASVRERGSSLVLSLHLPALALEHADRIVGLSAGRVLIDQPSAGLDPTILARCYGSLAALPDE